MFFENAFGQRSIHTDMIFKGFSCFLFYLLKRYCPKRVWTFSTSVKLYFEVGPRIIIGHDRGRTLCVIRSSLSEENPGQAYISVYQTCVSRGKISDITGVLI